MAEFLEPLKHLEVSPFIHEVHNRLLAFQQQEYDKNTLKYLLSRQPTGKPFDEDLEDFSGEPDQIIQIKNLSNALFLAEQVFEQLQKLNLSDINTIIGILKIREEADEASHLLLNLGILFEGVFKQEIDTVLSYLTQLYSFIESSLLKSKIDPKTLTFSREVGRFSGHIIEQMKPASGKLNYDLVTWFSGVLPTHIEAAWKSIETSATHSSFSLPNVDQEKMMEVGQKKYDKLSNSIKSIINTISRIKDPMSLIINLPALFTLPSHFKQMQPVLTEILQEVDHLDDTVQNFIHECLARLKYEVLPHLFSLVDKFEIQMLLEPGRLSSPLMDQIKPLHDMLIQISKDYLNVKFTGQAEHLLKIEDARFLALRLAPIHQQIDTSKRVLHQLKLALAEPDNHLQRPHLEQKQTDQTFKLRRNNELIESVHLKANIVLFEHNKTNNCFDMSEKEAFVHRHSLSDDIQFDDNGTITNPEQLADDEAWDLYQWYDNKLTDMNRAEQDCDHLLTALKANQKRNVAQFKSSTIAFHPDYIPCLLEDKIQHQPNRLYINIEGATLKYEVLEPLKTGCKLYLMPLEEAKKARHRNCYVWNSKIKQLSYIDANGQTQDKITLSATNKSMLIISIWKKNISRIKEFERRRREVLQVTDVELDDCNYLNLTAEYIANSIITPVGLIRTGTIPLSELNCPLTSLSSITPLKPYLPLVFDKALERGHIHNQEQSTCIRCYSSIQPYLVDAFKEIKIKDIQTFDKDVVNVFSGHVYKNASEPRTFLSFDDFRPQLLGLKNELPVKQKMLQTKRDQYFEQVRNKTFSVEPRPIDAIYHQKFSPDVAKFMLSIKPIKRQIHESNKTVLRVKQALAHLDKYCRRPNYNKHYPWFHVYLAQVTGNLEINHEINSVTAGQLKTHLKQIQFYEEADIKCNLLILKSIKSQDPHPADPCDLSEATAFMHLIHDDHPFRPCLMKDGNELEPGQLHLKIIEKQLHYKFLHYGKPQLGKIPLENLTPALNHFNEKSVLSKKAISNIMSFAYNLRKKQIESDQTLISSDEALDLYQWYRSISNDREDLSNEEQLTLQNKLDVYEHQAETKQPEAAGRRDLKCQQTQVEHDDRAHYLIKHKKCGVALAALKQSITNHFDHLADSFKQELKQPSYVLELMPEYSLFQQGSMYLKSLASYVVKMPKNSELKLEVLYLKDTGKTGLQYMVKRNKNEDGILGTINAKELAAIGIITLPLSKDGLIEQLKPKMTDLLNITSLRRHTPLSESPFPDVGTGTPNDFLVGILKIVFAWANWSPLFQEQRLEDIVMDAIAALRHYSKPDDNVKLPWPLKHAMNVTLPWALDRGVNVTLPWALDCLESYLKNSTSPFPSKVKTYSPHQVLAYKRLMNIVYYLEQIMYEIEKVNEDESKLFKLCHLLTSYLYYADIQPLVISLLADPHFSTFFQDIITNVKSLIKNITDESEHYSALDQIKPDGSPVKNLPSLYLMNVLKMLPERISLTSDEYKDKLPALKASSEKAIANIEKIINDYHDSFAYLRLFFDLPIIFGLLNELSESVTNFAHKAHARIKDDLDIAPPKFLTKIMMEADSWENTGLKPGAVSVPLKKILDEFYKGLITPLILDVDKQVSLLCDPSPTRQRIFSTAQRKRSAKSNSKLHKQASRSIQNILDTCNVAMGRLNTIERDKQTSKSMQDALDDPYKFSFAHTQLNEIEQDRQDRRSILNIRKCDDSFIRLNTIYKNALPIIKKALNGSNLYRMSFHEAKQAGHTDCFVWNDKTSLLFYIDSKGDPNAQNRYDLYLRSTPANEPIHLKSIYKFIKFMTRKPRQAGADQAAIYLSESEIKQFISSNSDFALKKNGVSLPDTDFISNLDEFVPNENNINPLKTLAIQCKELYERLYATSQLAAKAAHEQLAFLRDKDREQQASNDDIKQSVFTDYFNKKIDDLCNETEDLQGYTLSLLRGSVKIIPNHVYVNINGRMLDYQVIDPTGVKQKGSFELSAIGCTLERLASANELLPWLPAILKITSRRGDRHTRPYSLASEYRAKLKTALSTGRDLIIENAKNSDSKSIDNALTDAKTTFDTNYLEQYRQLNAINTALDDFMLYLNDAEKQWITRQSLFESAETIRGKRSTIDHLDALAANENDAVSVRIQKIKTYLIEDATLDHLINYANYESNSFAKLFQLIFRFFEAIGLYTPKVVQHVDKLLSALEGPTADVPAQSNRFLFFAAPTRKNIRTRADKLNTENEEPAPRV